MKNKSIKIVSSVLFYLVVAGGLIFGVMYLFRSDIMPYHYSFLDLSKEALDDFSPRIIELMVVLMKVGGANFLAICAASVFIVAVPFRNNKTWAKWALLFVFSISLVPLFFITWFVASHVPQGEPAPPWYLTLILQAMVIVAFALSLFIKKQDENRNFS